MSNEPVFQIKVSRKELMKIAWFLIGIDVFFILAYALTSIFFPHLPWGPVDGWFDLDRDNSIPSWFSSLQYVALAVAVLSTIGHFTVRGVSTRFLSILGLAMAFLGLDEAVGIHEQFTEAMKELNLDWMLSVSLTGEHGTWVFFYVLAGLGVTLLIYKDLLFLWREYRHEALVVIIGGVLLVLGEVGLEVISYLFLRTPAVGLFYNIEVMFEEGSALLGMSLLFYGGLSFLMKAQTAG